MPITVTFSDADIALIKDGRQLDYGDVAETSSALDPVCQRIDAAIERRAALIEVGHCPDCGHAPTGAHHYRSCSTRLPADYCAGCDTDRVLGRPSGAEHRCVDL